MVTKCERDQFKPAIRAVKLQIAIHGNLSLTEQKILRKANSPTKIASTMLRKRAVLIDYVIGKKYICLAVQDFGDIIQSHKPEFFLSEIPPLC